MLASLDVRHWSRRHPASDARAPRAEATQHSLTLTARPLLANTGRDLHGPRRQGSGPSGMPFRRDRIAGACPRRVFGFLLLKTCVGAIRCHCAPLCWRVGGLRRVWISLDCEWVPFLRRVACRYQTVQEDADVSTFSQVSWRSCFLGRSTRKSPRLAF
jgi:hypothetical protein